MIFLFMYSVYYLYFFKYVDVLLNQKDNTNVI